MSIDNRVKWTDERIERLTELWKLKVTSTEIAKQLGLTRNAVMGKVHRLGLFGKGPSKQLPPLGRKLRMPKPSPDVPRETPAPQEPAPKVVGPLNCKLVDLVETSCRWPIGDPQDWENFCYCGAQVHDRGPYCTKHFRGAWAKTAVSTAGVYFWGKENKRAT